jgi:hypothetical protein
MNDDGPGEVPSFTDNPTVNTPITKRTPKMVTTVT